MEYETANETAIETAVDSLGVAGLPETHTITRPKVSICMIVKNEEANLQRCLDSLLPIITLKNDETLEPQAELIVVDTGSTDRTVNVALKFTRKVYSREFIPWDFSAARNYAIEQACGEKVLVIDADEELDQRSVYRLEDLILNPAYDAENTWFFMIKNFSKLDRTAWTTALQPRMFRDSGDPIYHKRRHNQAKAPIPYAYVPSVVFNHYGYIWDENEELKNTKQERTIPALIEDYEKDPTDIHALMHLLKSASAYGKGENVIEYGEKWVELMGQQDSHEGWFAYYEGFVILAQAYIDHGRIEDAEKLTAMVEDKYTKRLIMLYFLIGRYWLDHDDDKALAILEYGLELASQPMKSYEMLLTTNIKQVIPEVLIWCAIKYFGRGDYAKAGKYLREAVMNSNGRLNLRWDIWNEVDASRRLIHDDDVPGVADETESENDTIITEETTHAA